MEAVGKSATGMKIFQLYTRGECRLGLTDQVR